MRLQSVLACLCAGVSAFGAEVSWTGGAGDGAWENGSNWNGGSVPGAGDVVLISGRGEVTLSSATAALASLDVTGATLTVSGWDSCVSAESVTIGEGGLVTSAGPFDDTQDGDGNYVNASRVWISCGDFTVAYGGAVDVSMKGFMDHSTQGGWNNLGYGPVPGQGRSRGAGHGGCATELSPDRDTIIGVLEAPVLPGSAGGSAEWDRGGCGGGVVRIEATGMVTVNGSVLANGGDKNSEGSGGAGGSIYITCNRFSGENGCLSAKGGTGNKQNAGNGGGGRIAVVYSTEAEQVDDVSGMTFDVSCGAYPREHEWFARDNQADCGTLYFPDAKLFLAQQGQGFAGQIHAVGFTSWTVEGDLTISKQLWLVNEGFQLNVTGDLIVTGRSTTFDIGGGDVEKGHRTSDWDLLRWQRYHSGTTPWRVTVGGSLRLEDGARFEGYSAVAEMADEATGYGGFVSVGGALNVGEKCVMALRSDATNGASVAISAGSVNIAEGSLVTAKDFGFQRGKGPGSGVAGRFGGGYGGFGGNHSVTTNWDGRIFLSGKPYGDAMRPWQPGSGGVDQWNDSPFRGAGGQVRITTPGTFTLDGVIDASAVSLTKTWGTLGAGSGGGILLECKKFEGSGSLMADGGDIIQNYRDRLQCPAGGGGRIAVYTGILYDAETMSESFLTVSEEAPETFSGTVSVKGGVYSYVSNGVEMFDEIGNGTDGTIRFVRVSIPYTVIFMR